MHITLYLTYLANEKAVHSDTLHFLSAENCVFPVRQGLRRKYGSGNRYLAYRQRDARK